MEDKHKQTTRLALLLTFMVVMLMVVSIGQFSFGDEANQQASALRVYED